MFTIHTVSLLFGLISGMLIGAGIAFYAVWKVEEEMGDDFARGFDKGWECGIDSYKLAKIEKEK